jgi:soluble lytic murein transglycosylase-like protein
MQTVSEKMRLSMPILRLLGLLIALLLPVSGFGAIYGYIDDQGVYHMTNIKPAQQKFQVLVPDQTRVVSIPLRGINRNQYDSLINHHSQMHGMDPKLVKAVMIAESNGNPLAISHKGAQGLMQIMPETAHDLQLLNPFDPNENIQAGTRYLRILHELFGGNLDLVLAAYNAGPKRVVQANMAIPRIEETINYVRRVKQYYDRLKYSQ